MKTYIYYVYIKQPYILNKKRTLWRQHKNHITIKTNILYPYTENTKHLFKTHIPNLNFSCLFPTLNQENFNRNF